MNISQVNHAAQLHTQGVNDDPTPPDSDQVTELYDNIQTEITHLQNVIAESNPDSEEAHMAHSDLSQLYTAKAALDDAFATHPVATSNEAKVDIYENAQAALYKARADIPPEAPKTANPVARTLVNKAVI